MKYLKFCFCFLWVLGMLTDDVQARNLPEISISMKNDLMNLNPRRTSSLLSPCSSSTQPIKETKSNIATSDQEKKTILDENLATLIHFDIHPSRPTSIFQILIDFGWAIASSPAKQAEETTADDHETPSPCNEKQFKASSPSTLDSPPPIPDTPIIPEVPKAKAPPINPDKPPIPEVPKAKAPPLNPDKPPIPEVLKPKAPPLNPDKPPIPEVLKTKSPPKNPDSPDGQALIEIPWGYPSPSTPSPCNEKQFKASSSSTLDSPPPIPDTPIIPEVLKAKAPPLNPDKPPIPEVLKPKAPPLNPDKPPIPEVLKTKSPPKNPDSPDGQALIEIPWGYPSPSTPSPCNEKQFKASSPSTLDSPPPIPDTPIIPEVLKAKAPPLNPDKPPIPEVLKPKAPPLNPDKPPIPEVLKTKSPPKNPDTPEGQALIEIPWGYPPPTTPSSTNNDQLEMVATSESDRVISAI